MKKIILIGGKARSGKDSIATMLSNKLDGKVLIMGFADYLKFFLTKYRNWDGKKDEKGRKELQYVGTEVMRNRDENFHVRIIDSVINVFKDEYDWFILPDMRFVNEAGVLQNHYSVDNVITIHVERLDFESNLTEEQKNHPSETALNDFYFDYYIKSVSGLDHLEVQADKLVEFIKTQTL